MNAISTLPSNDRNKGCRNEIITITKQPRKKDGKCNTSKGSVYTRLLTL